MSPGTGQAGRRSKATTTTTSISSNGFTREYFSCTRYPHSFTIYNSLTDDHTCDRDRERERGSKSLKDLQVGMNIRVHLEIQIEIRNMHLVFSPTQFLRNQNGSFDVELSVVVGFCLKCTIELGR